MSVKSTMKTYEMYGYWLRVIERDNQPVLLQSNRYSMMMFYIGTVYIDKPSYVSYGNDKCPAAWAKIQLYLPLTSMPRSMLSVYGTGK